MTRRPLRARLAWGLALALAAAPLGAQPPGGIPGAVVPDPRNEPFVLGRRIKIGAPIFGSFEVAGRIDSLIGDLVVLDTMLPRNRRGLFDGGSVPVEQYRRVRVRVGDIKQVWISDGVARTSAAIRYGLIGGLGAGLLFGVSGSSQYNPTWAQIREGAVPGLIAGGLIGGAIGLYNGRERWTLYPGPYYLDSPPVGFKEPPLP